MSDAVPFDLVSGRRSTCDSATRKNSAQRSSIGDNARGLHIKTLSLRSIARHNAVVSPRNSVGFRTPVVPKHRTCS